MNQSVSAVPTPAPSQKTLKKSRPRLTDMGAHQQTDPSSAPIPTVDIGAFFKAPFPSDPAFPSPAQTAIARQVDAAFRGSGFLHLCNFGLTEHEITTMYGLSDALFQKPDDEKLANLEPLVKGVNVGYVRSGIENLDPRKPGDLKEAFNFRFTPGLHQDLRGLPPGLADAARSLYETLTAAGDALATVCAVALGLPPTHFRAMLAKHELIMMRLINYPPCTPSQTQHTDYSTGTDIDANANADANADADADGGGRMFVRAGAHTDFGLFSFVFARTPGLQALSVAGDTVPTTDDSGDKTERQLSWVDVNVPCDARTAVVNVGGLMARVTNDRWRATAHRVVAEGDQCATRRLSIACFFDPDADTVVAVPPSLIEQGDVAKYEVLTAGEYVMQRLREAQEVYKEE